MRRSQIAQTIKPWAPTLNEPNLEKLAPLCHSDAAWEAPKSNSLKCLNTQEKFGIYRQLISTSINRRNPKTYSQC